MRKIVITGGLGYIGTELCKLFSGEARFKNIIVLDNRFISERVKQITDWGMTFIQGSILDKSLLQDVLHDADYVYHLAGVTDVAYVKTQSNEEKNREIIEYGIIGTRNVLEAIPQSCKLLFPSTHVVYEGLETAKFDVEEDEPTKAVLVYSSGKVQSEEDIKNSGKDYIIVRLASVYGYSTDTMRINIMPNLFSKITALNGTISLFSGGVQYKSLVSLIDVVRAMKFLAESEIERETFHLSNENMTIKQVANLCKKINPEVKIVETDDEIPNLGYTLSNKKLLSTGFKFLYNIEKSLEEMIHNWSIKKHPHGLEYVMRGEKEYIDERGKISNYELSEPINLIGYIESKAGTVRANHYHPIQEQKCLLIKGKYISVIKDLSVENAVIETRLIKEGDLAVIRPNVAHTMVFLEDSIFLNLVRGEREHENYGITHTIPYKLVDEKFRDDLINNSKVNCRSCMSENLKDVISFGLSPLANNLVDKLDENVDLYPLEVKYCDNCKNCQLSYTVPPQKMFDNYLYVSSTSTSFRKHFEDMAVKFIKDFNLTSDSLIVDIGSNDGVFLKPLKDRGINVIGVEPAKNIAEIANKFGVETINSYFTKEVVENILERGKKAKIVTASNVFAHSDKLRNMALDVKELLTEDGYFIIEVQYFLDTMKDLTFDNIYHEHTNYWTVTSLKSFFESVGMEIQKVEHINTHGGSIRVYVQDQSSKSDTDTSVGIFLEEEEVFGIKNLSTYLDFAERVKNVKDRVSKNMDLLKKEFDIIAAYGSPAKATTALNYFGIDKFKIDYTVEDNKMKVGKFIPGVNIPIVSKEFCNKNLPQLIIVLAWNFYDEIKSSNSDLIDKGVKFISIKDLQDENFSVEKIEKKYNLTQNDY